MKLLALDTSTLIPSVAVVTGDVAAHVHPSADAAPSPSSSPARVSCHSDNLLGMIDEALEDAGISLADVDGVAIGVGPGSFTGLRIGMATAKGLAFATGKPLWGVSSLAALALELVQVTTAGDDALYVPVLDARRNEVFAGFYRAAGRGVQAVATECVLSPSKLASHVAEIAQPGQRIVIGGDAGELYAEPLAAAGELVPGIHTPLATHIATLCAGVEQRDDILIAGAPVYIRPSEAEIKFPKGNPGGTFKRQES